MGRSLTLEPLSPEHSEGIVAVFADRATSRYLGVDLSDANAARAMVAQRLAYAGPPELGHWAFLRRGEVVGLGHLRPSHELPSGLIEIGWYIHPEHGGAGLATEGAATLLHYGLRDLGLAAIWALIHTENQPSLRLARRLGFVAVGTGHHYGAPHVVHVALPGAADLNDRAMPGRTAMTAELVPRSDSFRFRVFDAGDLADLQVLHGSPEAMRYLRPTGRPWTDAEMLAKVDQWQREQAEHGYTKWRVELPDGTFIGRAGLSPYGAGPPELGYSIVPALWGRGLATLLATEVLHHAFDALRLPEVIAFAMCGNAASLRVLQKIGMTPTHRTRIDGLLYDFFHITTEMR